MDVLNDQLIDIGLNVLGYLIAGALGMLVFSTFRGNRRVPVAVPAEVAPPQTPAPTASPGKRNLEFVSFRQDSPTARPEAPQPADTRPQIDRNKRSDRAEIVRLAREMIKAGAPGETIRRTLPISEGELALLLIGKQ